MKRIIMMLTVAVMLVAALTITAGGAIAAPADPKPPPEQSGPGDPDGAQEPGTCTITTQKGANVTTSETQGSCKNQKVDDEPEESKALPGQNKPA